MTQEETNKIMGLLQFAYPTFYRGINKKDAYATAALWHQMFADDDFHEVQAAVKLLISTKVEGYPPTIGAVKQKIAELRGTGQLTAQDAWALVNKAVRSMDWFAPEKQFNKLPETVQRAVGSPSVLKEWGMTDESAFETVIYSQFIKAYTVYQSRERDMAAVPSDVREMLAGMAERLSFPAEGGTAT